jgi:hypothetical protein
MALHGGRVVSSHRSEALYGQKWTEAAALGGPAGARAAGVTARVRSIRGCTAAAQQGVPCVTTGCDEATLSLSHTHTLTHTLTHTHTHSHTLTLSHTQSHTCPVAAARCNARSPWSLPKSTSAFSSRTSVCTVATLP